MSVCWACDKKKINVVEVLLMLQAIVLLENNIIFLKISRNILCNGFRATLSMGCHLAPC